MLNYRVLNLIKVAKIQEEQKIVEMEKDLYAL